MSLVAQEVYGVMVDLHVVGEPWGDFPALLSGFWLYRVKIGSKRASCRVLSNAVEK